MNLLVLQILLLPLATWRLYRLLAQDTGYRQILRKLRVRAGVVYAHDATGGIDWGHWTSKDGSLGELITCCYCSSLWWGFWLTTMMLYAPLNVTLMVLLPLNLSAICLLFENKVWRQ